MKSIAHAMGVKSCLGLRSNLNRWDPITCNNPLRKTAKSSNVKVRTLHTFAARRFYSVERDLNCR